MRLLEQLVTAIRGHMQRQPHPGEAEAQAALDAYEKEYRRVLLHRPRWWRLIGRDHIANRS